jgi:hypothetical protein
MAARQSAVNTVTMTGSLRRLQELAAYCIHSSLPVRERRRRRIHGCPSECN